MSYQAWRRRDRQRKRLYDAGTIVLGLLGAVLSLFFWAGLVYFGATADPDSPDISDRTYRGP